MWMALTGYIYFFFNPGKRRGNAHWPEEFGHFLAGDVRYKQYQTVHLKAISHLSVLQSSCVFLLFAWINFSADAK